MRTNFRKHVAEQGTAEQGTAEEVALKNAMEPKSREFAEAGAELCSRA
jgi:hypothetical protein